MAKACVFCGSTPTTGEHVIPKWMASLFPAFTASAGTGEIIGADGAARRYTIPLFEQQVNAVCAGCNGGWMGNLEGNVAPFLGPMLATATRTRLRPSRQKLLATWAVKTAFMLQQIHPASEIIPDTEYKRFYATKQPPHGYVVWLALRPITNDIRSGRQPFTETRQQRIAQMVVPDADSRDKIKAQVDGGAFFFRSTFAIGNVAFMVFGHNMKQGALQIGFGGTNARLDIMRWIWPVQRREWWPPRESIAKIGGFDGLHKIFDAPPEVASGNVAEDKG